MSTKLTRDELETKVRVCISESADLCLSQITLDAKLVHTFGLDSLDLVELGLDIEGTFDIDLPSDHSVENCETVRDIADVVEKAMAYQEVMAKVSVEQAAKDTLLNGFDNQQDYEKYGDLFPKVESTLQMRDRAERAEVRAEAAEETVRNMSHHIAELESELFDKVVAAQKSGYEVGVKWAESRMQEPTVKCAGPVDSTQPSCCDERDRLMHERDEARERIAELEVRLARKAVEAGVLEARVITAERERDDVRRELEKARRRVRGLELTIRDEKGGA